MVGCSWLQKSFKYDYFFQIFYSLLHISVLSEQSFSSINLRGHLPEITPPPPLYTPFIKSSLNSLFYKCVQLHKVCQGSLDPFYIILLYDMGQDFSDIQYRCILPSNLKRNSFNLKRSILSIFKYLIGMSLF